MRLAAWAPAGPSAVITTTRATTVPAPGTGSQEDSWSAGSTGRPASARIRWLIASVIPKVSH